MIPVLADVARHYPTSLVLGWGVVIIAVAGILSWFLGLLKGGKKL